MQTKRGHVRMAVDVPVTITTVLESLEATVVDLTEYGAQISGASLPQGAPFQLDRFGHSVFAVVQWSEVDRMGVKFLFALRDGPLYEALEQARAMRHSPAGLRIPVGQYGAVPFDGKPFGAFGRRMA